MDILQIYSAVEKLKRNKTNCRINATFFARLSLRLCLSLRVLIMKAKALNFSQSSLFIPDENWLLHTSTHPSDKYTWKNSVPIGFFIRNCEIELRVSWPFLSSNMTYIHSNGQLVPYLHPCPQATRCIFWCGIIWTVRRRLYTGLDELHCARAKITRHRG